MKPQFGLMLAVVVVVCREWAILTELALSASIQLLLVSGLLGPMVLSDYLEVLRHMATWQDALEPSPEQMHSLAVLTRLLPAGVSLVAWAIGAVVVSTMTVRVWRSAAPLYVRAGVLVLGSALVNPHLFVYDGAVLAGPLVSLSGWIEMQAASMADVRRKWHLAIYALFAFMLFPTARIIVIQFSPLVMFCLLHLVYRSVTCADDDRVRSTRFA